MSRMKLGEELELKLRRMMIQKISEYSEEIRNLYEEGMVPDNVSICIRRTIRPFRLGTGGKYRVNRLIDDFFNHDIEDESVKRYIEQDPERYARIFAGRIFINTWFGQYS